MKKRVKRKNIRKITFPLISLILLTLSLVLTLILAYLLETKKLQSVMQYLTFAAPRNSVTHGPIFGNVTDHSATIWARINSPTDQVVKIQLANKPGLLNKNINDGNTIVVTMHPADFASSSHDQISWDNTWKAEVQGLSEETTYYVGINVAGSFSKLSPLPHFKTFSKAGESTNFKFALFTDFGTNNSSQKPLPYPVDTFKSLTQERIPTDFVIIGGDLWHYNVGDPPTSTNLEFVKGQRQQFKRMYSLNSLSGYYDDFVNSILSSYPVVHFYDDHDIGVNNADNTFKWKSQALQVLKDYFPVYNESSMNDGDWQQFSYGQADFFVLDARSQRSPNSTPNTDPNKTLLGPAQYDWLTQNLQNSTAKWKFIITPVVFNPTNGKNDSWSGFPIERDKLISFIKNNGIPGVVMISGDSHGGGIDDGTNSIFPELFVPGPNLDHCFTTSLPGRWSAGIYGSYDKSGGDPPCPGYGTVRVMTNPDRIVMRVRNDKGELKLILRYFLHPEDQAKYNNLPDEEN